MFCLECGSEMAIRATACPFCGHVYGDRERSLTDLQPAGKAGGSLTSEATATSATPAHTNAPTVKYVGEVGPTGLPRDLPGRFVLGISLGLAADLLLPWVSVNGTNVTPASIGAPVIVVVALLAAAALPVFTISLRQHPVWSGLPLIVGAFCAGIAGSVWLLLAPLAQIFAQSFGSDPTNLALSPQGGLYLFLIGSAALLVSGQRMLAATHEAQLADIRRDAARALQSRQATPTRPAPAPTASSSAASHSAVVANPSGQAAQAAGQGAGQEAAPAAQSTSATPVLPGSDAWHQAPAAPTPMRSTIGGGWGKSRGPQRLR